jgi:ACS family tartrate transporter-like MFS transporter
MGNLGGFFGPTILGFAQKTTGSYAGGLYYLSGSMFVAACMVWFMGLGAKTGPRTRS